MQEGYLILTQPLDVYEQMAIDEFLCERMPKKYILKFFNWKGPSITFGYSQRYKEVKEKLNNEDKELPITRRPTGGGIVLHKEDLTFSFIFYNPGEFKPHTVYEKLHSTINESYKKEGFNLEILNQKTETYKINSPVMNCFSNPVEKDLMLNGKKILGGALRKFSDYMLYQASLQIEKVRDNSNLNMKIIKNALEIGYNINFKEYEVTKKDFEIISKIAYNKYKTKEWIERI